MRHPPMHRRDPLVRLPRRPLNKHPQHSFPLATCLMDPARASITDRKCDGVNCLNRISIPFLLVGICAPFMQFNRSIFSHISCTLCNPLLTSSYVCLCIHTLILSLYHIYRERSPV
ncbi:transmembrane protein, putative [Rhizoctonia solani AG-3 Rhs1AP]|uniref:Transmembrane protein, putative n=2 Tax=Rhizoctonia solani AG-3 TaxID=1086053 RepID=X8IY63_9AGAM|nr:transmembrane protein, putative [Rhizoctonia solani AG-3 Rhs1AP]KEP51871.1 putative transmembrane protein [Rhizoctonia solani 123E]